MDGVIDFRWHELSAAVNCLAALRRRTWRDSCRGPVWLTCGRLWIDPSLVVSKFVDVLRTGADEVLSRVVKPTNSSSLDLYAGIRRYESEFVAHFSELTTPEIEAKIDETLSEKQRFAIRASLAGLPVDLIAERTGSNRNSVPCRFETLPARDDILKYAPVFRFSEVIPEGLEQSHIATAHDVRDNALPLLIVHCFRTQSGCKMSAHRVRESPADLTRGNLHTELESHVSVDHGDPWMRLDERASGIKENPAGTLGHVTIRTRRAYESCPIALRHV